MIELLHRIMDIIKDYFGAANEALIKEHYVIVYEVSDYLYYMRSILVLLVHLCGITASR